VGRDEEAIFTQEPDDAASKWYSNRGKWKKKTENE